MSVPEILRNISREFFSLGIFGNSVRKCDFYHDDAHFFSELFGCFRLKKCEEYEVTNDVWSGNPFPYQMEKPRAFDPRRQSGVDPRKPFCFDPCKVLTDGVIFILPDYFLAFIFLMLSPVSSIRCDEWTILSSTASATAWSPIASYQFSTGSCDAITIDFLS